jgi:hypothetical protein
MREGQFQVADVEFWVPVTEWLPVVQGTGRQTF